MDWSDKWIGNVAHGPNCIAEENNSLCNCSADKINRYDPEHLSKEDVKRFAEIMDSDRTTQALVEAMQRRKDLTS